MKTITTKYLPATNFRGARVKASHTAGAQSVTLSWDYALNSEANHRMVTSALAHKLDWAGEWVGGCLNERGNVYVLITGETIDGFRVEEHLMTTIQTHFRARNENPTIKALAEAAAVQKSLATGKPHKVVYRDHYNDYSVVGDYCVVPA